MLTADRLREVMRYDAQTGHFTRIAKTGSKGRIGEKCGGVSGNGYFVVAIDRRTHYAHRLAWLYMTSEWPVLVDHIDGNPLNNAWSNLRLATKAQNAANSKTTKANKCGFKGVSFHASARKFQAHIGVAGKSVYLGLFDTADEAHAAYVAAAHQHFGEFGRAA